MSKKPEKSGTKNSRKKTRASSRKKLTESIVPLDATVSHPIVGIGASAGGLDAFMEMFRSMPINTGMAFVLIQHLSPQHVSMLSDFVRKATKMRVYEAQDGMRVQPDCIYVIPPNAILEIFHGALHIRSLEGAHASIMAVNAFFNSLARDQGNLAVGVVLSGTGSDGAQGMREIKAEGGITFVQDPKNAKYDGMPKAAIATGSVDHVLPIDALARELVTIATHPIVKASRSIEDLQPSPETNLYLQKIFILLRGATKIDFSGYKLPTIIRRINRRMVLHKIETLRHYLRYLQSTPQEVRALFEDLLINVTDFFRDNDAFESLKNTVFPEIVKDRPQGLPIRIWVPGCSTGEEVYSIAILLLEYLGDSVSKYPIQIYGTDICEAAIKVARTGFYPETSSMNISPTRLNRYFLKEQGGYRISRIVRDRCVFSLQDVTSQPPINRLDLLSCRNLMIYLGPAVQKKLMATFFYALNARGFLMLGASESIGAAASLFVIVDKKNKIYLKRSNSLPPRVDFSNAAPFLESTMTVDAQSKELLRRPEKSLDPVAEAERLVLERHAPAWLLVNQAMDIVQFRGKTEHFVTPSSGQPSWNLLKMLREGLLPDTRVLVHSALKERTTVRKAGLRVRSNGHFRTIDVEASPIGAADVEPHCLLVFLERGHDDAVIAPPVSSKKHKAKSSDPKEGEIECLRSELISTQKSLQTIIEDQNSTNEELQSANEEVLSANEELQSTNEELETAKEELQSTNEELTSLNEELSTRNNELAQVNNDLTNVLSNTTVPIVIVGPDIHIRRFTPTAEKLLNLIAGDVGRKLTDINIGFNIANLHDRVAQVIDTIDTIELECQNANGHWYAVRIRPYKTADNKIDGAVIVFVDINDVKTRENQALAANLYSEAILQTVRDPLVVLDGGLRVERVNQAFYETFKVSPKETLGRLLYELGNRQWDITELRILLEDILPLKSEVRDYIISHKFESIGEKRMLLNAMALKWEGQKKTLILLAIHDLNPESL